MRAIIIMAAGLGTILSGAAAAQTAKNTPEGIICAITGSCDAQSATGDRVPIGEERAFSLARPSGATASPTTPRASAATPPRQRVAAARPARRPVTPAKVRPGGGVDMLVSFDLGSSRMTPQAQAEAHAFAQAMAAPAMQGLRFAIEGHTDQRGTREMNMALSQARAQSVKDYLVSQGVDADRLTAKGYGPDKPLRGTRATSPANRRVEFVKQA